MVVEININAKIYISCLSISIITVFKNIKVSHKAMHFSIFTVKIFILISKLHNKIIQAEKSTNEKNHVAIPLATLVNLQNCKNKNY